MRCRLRLLFAVVGCFTLAASVSAGADERLEDRACRSVHLRYDAGPGVALYNEVTVDQSAPGTYFCACGWNAGYFGIQELGNGKKLVIFSVWDSKQNDPKAVPEEKRVKLVHKGERVRIGRFGGEGSGGQSFLDYDWKLGATYRFLVTAKADGERAEYAGYIRGPGDSDWIHMITFSTITDRNVLSGYYSFVEDFKRDGASATKPRSARFGNTWVKATSGEWTPAVKAQFTADGNPALNIDAGAAGDLFFLTTGGETKNQGTRLNERIALPPNEKRTRPDGLPQTD